MLRCYEPAHIVGVSKPHTCWQHQAALTGGVTSSEPARTAPAVHRPVLRVRFACTARAKRCSVTTGGRPIRPPPRAARRGTRPPRRHGVRVGQDDVVDTETRRRDGQSVVAVRAGEQLTERHALMAILSPSANNVAVLVARQVDGSVAAFVAEMNRTARALGMSHTTYTGPSGYATTARSRPRSISCVWRRWWPRTRRSRP
jgi:hypothetical protein